jgi:hypothetical protein
MGLQRIPRLRYTSKTLCEADLWGEVADGREYLLAGQAMLSSGDAANFPRITPRADLGEELGIRRRLLQARKINSMTAFSGETEDEGRRRSPDRGSLVRLSINLSAETADAFKALIERKGLTITEGIRRAITVWKFVEDETAKGNEIAVIEQDDSIRKVVLL